jgi:uncharacterized protein
METSKNGKYSIRMIKILVTGGNGLIGRHLCKHLQDKGYDVAILSRTKQKSTFPTYLWDWERTEIEKEAIESADYIVHLAGANIGDKRWTKKRKQQILDSRVKTGELIFKKIKEQNKNLGAFISASAIGYYGSVTSDKIFTETDPSSDDFLGNVCKKWEDTADKFRESGIRTVKIRTGVVLTKQRGALDKFITPSKIGLGSAIGNGKQYVPWIHIDDLCNIYIKAIEDNEMDGAFNAVAPDYKTNKEFAGSIARILNKPFWFPGIPSILIKMIFGRMSDIFLLGSRVSSDKIKLAGYTFQFPDLEGALSDLISYE